MDGSKLYRALCQSAAEESEQLADAIGAGKIQLPYVLGFWIQFVIEPAVSTLYALDSLSRTLQVLETDVRRRVAECWRYSIPTQAEISPRTFRGVAGADIVFRGVMELDWMRSTPLPELFGRFAHAQGQALGASYGAYFVEGRSCDVILVPLRGSGPTQNPDPPPWLQG